MLTSYQMDGLGVPSNGMYVLFDKKTNPYSDSNTIYTHGPSIDLDFFIVLPYNRRNNYVQFCLYTKNIQINTRNTCVQYTALQAVQKKKSYLRNISKFSFAPNFEKYSVGLGSSGGNGTLNLIFGYSESAKNRFKAS